MKCPGCRTKYSGKRCPNCGRHTDPNVESRRIVKIALLFIILIAVAAIAYYLIATRNYINGIQDMINRILG